MGSGKFFEFRCFLRDLHPPKPQFLPEHYPDLTGKIALVTGASAGIGVKVAKLLASKNCHVFMGVRNKEKAEAAIKRILSELGDNDGKPIGELSIIVFDLADLSSIETGVRDLESKTDKLNIIIHNAAVMMCPAGSKSAQGFELQFATNVMGPYLLQKKLDPLFINGDTDYKRLIWTSSYGHVQSPPNGGINWDDIFFYKDPSQVVTIYGQSKAGDVLLAGMWPQHHAEEVEKQHIVSVSVHPGLLQTELARSFSTWGQRALNLISYDPVYGAYSELYPLLSPDISYKDNGSYYIPWGRIGELRDDVRESITNGNGERLWQFLDKETSQY